MCVCVCVNLPMANPTMLRVCVIVWVKGGREGGREGLIVCVNLPMANPAMLRVCVIVWVKGGREGGKD